MPEKILYYLGAGASAQALPIARKIKIENNALDSTPVCLPDELTNLDFNTLSAQATNAVLSVSIHALKNEFKELSDKAKEFGDVDTYAKYLNLINPDGSEIKKLKQSLSQFFAIKQMISGARDPRYLPWLVSIMDRKIFPENIKILSWNYDFQVQLAGLKIGPNDSSSIVAHYPNFDPNWHESDELSLIHLNGIAGYASFPFPLTVSVLQPKRPADHDYIFDFIINNDLYSKLHFAWEQSDYHAKLMKYVEQMILGTTILVVIGYSFPFFNREVDKKIMAIIKRHPFKKIYYQDPRLTGEQLRSQFGLPQKFRIQHIKYTDNFHIPFEY